MYIKAKLQVTDLDFYVIILGIQENSVAIWDS